MRISSALVFLLAATAAVVPAAQATAADSTVPAIPAGTAISIRTLDPIDSKKAQAGQEFRVTLDEPLVVGEQTLADRGADAFVQLTENKKSGRVKGRAVLILQLVAVTIKGQRVAVSTGDSVTESASQGKKTAVRTGVGAGAGAVIGGILGGGKGAGLGAMIGGGAGASTAILSGQRIKIPAETRLTFTVSAEAAN